MGEVHARGNELYFHAPGPGSKGGNDIWVTTWDGTTWIQKAASGYPGRAWHAFAYDALRQRCVMAGGATYTVYGFADTWEWDGTQWAEIQIDGPTPGEIIGVHHTYPTDEGAMFFDARLGTMVLVADSGTWVLSRNLNVLANDRDVDQTDFAHMQACFSGESVPQEDEGCASARLDRDPESLLDQLLDDLGYGRHPLLAREHLARDSDLQRHSRLPWNRCRRVLTPDDMKDRNAGHRLPANTEFSPR